MESLLMTMKSNILCFLLLTLLLTNSCADRSKYSNTQVLKQVEHKDVVEKIEEIKLPVITYDFPRNNANPFDLSTDDRYFINAAGFTNLTDNLDDFSNLNVLEQEIPMGRKTIIICQKICFVNKGTVIKKWNFDKANDTESKINGRYCLFSNEKRKTFLTDWKRDVVSYSILRATADASIYSYLWDSFEEAEEFAKEISLNENVTVMISMVIDNHSWH